MTEETLTFIEPVELGAKMESGAAVIVVDARNPEEFAAGRVPGSRNVPLTEMPDALTQMTANKPDLIVTTCGSTGRGEKAAHLMTDDGFTNIAVLRGGLTAWRKEGLPVEGSGRP